MPHLDPQPSSFYFNSRRRIDLFGICSERTGIQTNYLIDECQRIGKGPNMVLSMLHHYIFGKAPPGKKIILYADNCPGQNKNQTLVAYCCYLVQSLKRHPEIEINFMIVGHTKFSPDRHFGTVKKLIRRSGCRSIINPVGEAGLDRESAQDNDIALYADPVAKEKSFEWYKFDEFLKKKYGSCRGIHDSHTIKITPNSSKISVLILANNF